MGDARPGPTRKRKWNEPVGSGGAPQQAAVLSSALQPDSLQRAHAAAAAAAAAVSARLAELQPVAAPPAPPAVPVAPSVEVVLETVDLCGLPAHARSLLTKKSTQEEVARITGAFISTKGRFVAPGTSVPVGDVPLHLAVTPGSSLRDASLENKRQAVGQAACLLRELITDPNALRHVFTPPAAALPPPPPLPPPGGVGMVTLTLPVGIDATADPAFALVARITGPNNAYLDHIAAQTGASVTLRGAGTGVAEGEATAVHFAAPRVPVLNAAAGLVTSLLDTIRDLTRLACNEIR